MPRGGATPVGGLGFAHAAHELQEQLAALGIEPARVVVATGSGGTQAGLLAGAAAYGVSWPVHGASVSRPVDEIADRVLHLAAACSELLGGDRPRPQDVHVRDARGLGFGIADERESALVRRALTADGLVLDHTYTAKALQLAIELGREGGPTVFWHTGGTVSAVTGWSHGGTVG
jgi:1-aminocyclopropane-1-carboxylate deaminase/D-cysteine desulfhydrase-like pyridoxal-dependent ACC family enzyme